MPAIMLDVGALLIRVCRMLDRLCWLHMDVPNVTGHAQAGLNICTVVLVERESPNLPNRWRRSSAAGNLDLQDVPTCPGSVAHSAGQLQHIASAGSLASLSHRLASLRGPLRPAHFDTAQHRPRGPDRHRKGCLTDQPLRSTSLIKDLGVRQRRWSSAHG